MTSKRFNGGIQDGTVATDPRARKLDDQCKHTKDSAFALLKVLYPKLTLQKKLTQEQIPGGIGGCQPDGGAWFYDGVLILAVEGKKQQNRGNAIERWFKNNFICRLINPQVSYITFCTGEGAFMNWVEKEGSDELMTYGQIVKALNVAHLDGFDKYNPGKNSAFLNSNGFTKQEMQDILIEAITERIDAISHHSLV
jgi:hypothetical protein